MLSALIAALPPGTAAYFSQNSPLPTASRQFQLTQGKYKQHFTQPQTQLKAAEHTGNVFRVFSIRWNTDKSCCFELPDVTQSDTKVPFPNDLCLSITPCLFVAGSDNATTALHEKTTAFPYVKTTHKYVKNGSML